MVQLNRLCFVDNCHTICNIRISKISTRMQLIPNRDTSIGLNRIRREQMKKDMWYCEEYFFKLNITLPSSVVRILRSFSAVMESCSDSGISAFKSSLSSEHKIRKHNTSLKFLDLTHISSVILLLWENSYQQVCHRPFPCRHHCLFLVLAVVAVEVRNSTNGP